MNPKAFTIRLCFFFLITQQLFAQGVLQGVVKDSTSGQELIGANVFLKGTAMGAVSDIEGKYKIGGIPEGTYSLRFSYLGFTTKIIEVKIVGDQTIVINSKLVPDVIEGNEVVITAQARGQLSAMNQQLKSTTIVNVVSEEKIKELPDANAAEAIGRLPGVSLIRSGGEANKVVLRGMSDKFSSITIDGVKIPATDENSRGVDLSTISQSSLSGVELFKALTPDKDADAIAGSVNLVTKRAPSERFVAIDAKGNYNKLMDSYDQYDFSFRYGERFFENVFGIQVTGNKEKKIRSNEEFNIEYNTALNNSTDYAINNFLLQFTDEIRHRDNLSLLIDFNTPDSGTIRFNNNYNQTNRDYTIFTRNYPTNDQVLYTAQNREQEINTYSSSIRGDNYLLGLSINWGGAFAQSISDVPYDYTLDFLEPSRLENGVVVSGMRPTPKIKERPEQLISFALNNFYAATCSTAFFQTEKNIDKEKTAFFDIKDNVIVAGQFSWELKIGAKYKTKDRLKESGQLYSPYYLGYFQGYNELADGSLVKKNFTGTRFENFYSVFESSNGQIRLPSASSFMDNVPASRKLYDTYNLYPMLNRDAVRLWYDLNKNGKDVTGAREYFDDPTIDAEYYKIVERVYAGYAMNTFNFSEDMTFIGGVRFEKEDNNYDSKFSPQSIGGFPVPQGIIRDTSASYSELIVLPNFHLTLRPTEFINVRLAAYKALARPDFNLRLEKFIGSGVNTLVLGNPKLKTAKAWNYELNSSFFSNSIGLITVSAFYKEIDDMFHLLEGASVDGNGLIDSLGLKWKTPYNGTYQLTVPYNSAKPTLVWGFEFEHQVNLNFLPGLLQNIVLSYNASIVRSETHLISTANGVKYDSVDIGGGIFIPIPINFTYVQEKKQKLEGQPEFYGNIALGYDIEGFSARISLFHQAEYNRSFSGSGRGDFVNNKFTRIDLALKQKVTEYLAVMLNISNLTGVDESYSQMNRIVGYKILRNSEKYDLAADLGIRLEF